MINPQIGQRWLVDTDTSLGLGIVTAREGRQVTIEFPAVDETRHYSINNAPLTQVVFTPGDTIDTDDGREHRVESVEVINNLNIYINQDGDPIPETRLNATMRLNHPLKRLLAGQLDKPKWFGVREMLSKAHQSWRHADLAGLLGARINLNPHQLYVAKIATEQFPIRALLADEVGLGKTIEAGLILKRLQHQNLVNRTLVLVPEALCVQWFVELLRCFSIQSVLVEDDTEFNDYRVYIAAHDCLFTAENLAAAEWDMVIIDEAHQFDLRTKGPEHDMLRQLSGATEHLLLLTATPERLGLESHFLRLQLLDPETFHDFEAFQESASSYHSLAQHIQDLITGEQETLSDQQSTLLAEHFGLSLNQSLSTSSVIELLLDSHGTGRRVFRNTRSSVPGFPTRQLIIHDLTIASPQSNAQDKHAWLADFIQQHDDDKTLLITHKKEDVLALKEWIFRNIGLDCPVFHEDMTLVERDRSAAYFADTERGAPLLLCSEIGSEGRNFQFCHRLICWDLPDHPDVLEQRIGRLDRIGQTQDIEIHVCLGNSEDQARLQWFHDILNAIEKTNPAAGIVHDKWFQQYGEDPDNTAPTVQQELNDMLVTLENGRDWLLELNSCRQPAADNIVASVQEQEGANNPQLLLEKMANVLNLNYDKLSHNIYQLIPSEHMLVPLIPGLPEEGAMITFDRETACARDDVEFVTWDHPLMQGLAEMISGSDLGVASISLLPSKRFAPGTIFAETLYTISVQSAHAKQIQRYLKESCLRIVLTAQNPKNLAHALPSEKLEKALVKAPKPIQRAVLREGAETINQLADQSLAIAKEEMTSIIKDSQRLLAERVDLELGRLEQLKNHNCAISEEHIGTVKAHYEEISQALEQTCKPAMSAIRLIVTKEP